MKFFTHNDKLIDVSDTSLIGHIEASYEDVVAALGYPTCSDGHKVDVEWQLAFEDGAVITVYNWKNGPNYIGSSGTPVYKMRGWNVGSNRTDWPEKALMIERIKHILESVKTKKVFKTTRRDGLTEVLVPPGTYAIGDPCYFVPDEHWEDLLQSAKYFDRMAVGKVAGHSVIAFSTRYGDGTYVDQFDRKYPVDSGLIGLVPKELADQCPTTSAAVGDWLVFNQNTVCSSDGSTLKFGKVTINTEDDF